MMTALTAAPTSAAAQTITGSDPPGSSESRLSAGPGRPAIRRPTGGHPVKATRRTAGCETSASPISAPRPVTTVSTPSGTPASENSFGTSSAAGGVGAAGFATTVLPLASAGATLVPSSVSGKLYGVIAAHTPIGRRITRPYAGPNALGSSWYAPRTCVAASA